VWAVGVDSGGTFTDLVAIDADTSEFRLSKVLSTPRQPQDALFAALGRAELEPAEVDTLVHGTTVATNALLERTVANVALLATAGFRDLLFLQRGTRPDPYDLSWRKPHPVLPRRWCFDVPERLTADGRERQPLDEQAVRAIVRSLRDGGEVEAIAVAYLYSYLDAAHERRTRELILEEWPGVSVSLSSDVLPRWREYERTSTTVIDASLKPRIESYMSGLAERCAASGVGRVSILRSNGGVMTIRRAAEHPVTLVRSGPSGGIVACQAIGATLGLGDLIAADMGGTSFEAALLTAGEPLVTTNEELEWGIPISVPMLDVRSIGSGGGSILDVDAAGLLKVGPESAGSDPGPACYGRGGTRPTVADANVVLGRLSESFALGGTQRISRELAREAIRPLSDKLKLSVEEVARGALQVCNHSMAQALRLVSTDRGYDPRGAALIAYGGAGPLHACELARELRIGLVVVPPHPGAFSALGALLADARFDYTATRIVELDGAAGAKIEEVRGSLTRVAERDLREEQIGDASLVFEVDVCYVGQNWELAVHLPESGPDLVANLRHDFEALHERLYGFRLSNERMQLTGMRLVARAPRTQFELPRATTRAAARERSAERVHFEGFGAVETRVLERASLASGDAVPAPALLGQLDSTVVIPPDASATVHETSAILIALPDGRS